VCNRDGDTGETLDLRELRCRCNLEYRFAYANYSPPEEVVGTWASVDLAAAIRTRMIRSGKATQRFTSRTVKPYRAPREHYALTADCIHR
jgi:hypothetical protein